MVIPATQLRAGMVILYNNDLYRVTNVTHLTPGNWRGMVHTKLRSLRTGNATENRFRSEDKLERVALAQLRVEKGQQQDATRRPLQRHDAVVPIVEESLKIRAKA